MSVHADYSHIKDWTNVCYSTDEKGESITNPILNTIVLMSAAGGINMNSITEKNLEEWAFRLWFCQKLFGPLGRYRRLVLDENGNPTFDKDGNEKMEIVDYDLDIESIRPFIGLTTNIAEYNRAKFKNDMMRRARLTFEDEMKKRNHND